MKKLFTLLSIIIGLSVSSPAEDTPKPYPLETCLISGEKLDAMGKPMTVIYEGQEMKFCCKYCAENFQSDPQKYLKQVQAAAAVKK